MEIYLIRHTAVDVSSGCAYGQSDVACKDTFEEEAAVVKSEIDGITFDAVYSSPLSRCTKLAEYCGYGDAILENRVKEMNFGDWEMKSWLEIATDPASKAWFADWISTPAPGGESMSEMNDRVTSFFEEVKNSGKKRVAVFAHGGVLTLGRVYVGEYPLIEALANVPTYGTVLKIEID